MAVSEGWLRAYVADAAGSPRHTIDTNDLSFSYTSGGYEYQGVKTISGGTFTTLTIPDSAKGIAVKFATTATNITVKGVTGDTGVIHDAANGIPYMQGLRGKSSVVGFQNGGANTTAEVWFI